MKKLNHLRWTSRRADAALLSVAVVWGSGFIATERALLSGLMPEVIMTVRFWIAVLILLPFQGRKLRRASRRALGAGIGAGALLCAAFFAQIYGQAATTISNSAFLTAANVVMVPFILRLFTREKPAVKYYPLALGTLAGAALLTLNAETGLTLRAGDGIVLLSALLFAAHIAFLGTAAREQDAGFMTLMQMLTCALLSTAALLAKNGAFPAALPGQDYLPVVYLALFSTCLCFFAQTAAQQHTSAAKAAILLSCEGLFGALFSVLLGYEPYTWRMAAGGALIILCAMLTQVDFLWGSPGTR